MKTNSIDEIFTLGDIEKVNENNLDKDESIEYKKLEEPYKIHIPYDWDIEMIIKKFRKYLTLKNVA